MSQAFRKFKIPFPLVDIYFFKWNYRKQTNIHNHCNCYMFLLNGVLKETLYNKNLRRINTNIYKTPSISFINNSIGYHDITVLRKHTYSIHVYYPKNFKNTYYN